MSFKKFFYIVKERDTTHEMLKASYQSTHILNNSVNPSIEKLISFENSLRKVTSSSNGETSNIIPMNYSFSNAFAGFTFYTKTELIENLKGSNWSHNQVEAPVAYSITKSMQFDSGGFFTSENSNSLHNPSELSVLIRFKITEEYPWSENQVLLSKSSLNAPDRGWRVGCSKTNGALHFRSSSDGSNLYTCYTNMVLNTNQWYSAVVSCSSGSATVYVDTVDVTTAGYNDAASPLHDSPIKLAVSGFHEGIYEKTSSTITEVALWNKALSQNEVNEIGLESVDLESFATNSNLISWYRLGEDIYNDAGTWKVPDIKGVENLIASSLTDTNTVVDVPTA